jgi:hypothetical protein
MMKLPLSIDRAMHTRIVNDVQAERLRRPAADAFSPAINVLASIGVVAAAGGIAALRLPASRSIHLSGATRPHCGGPLQGAQVTFCLLKADGMLK